MVWTISSAEAWLAWADAITKWIRPGWIITLSGPLGAGKTSLVQALLAAWGFEGVAHSPTYSLVECYDDLPQPVRHFDLYRLQSPEAWLDDGLADACRPASNLSGMPVILIEWPERAAAYLQEVDLAFELGYQELTQEQTQDQILQTAELGRWIKLTGGRQLPLLMKQWRDDA